MRASYRRSGRSRGSWGTRSSFCDTRSSAGSRRGVPDARIGHASKGIRAAGIRERPGVRKLDGRIVEIGRMPHKGNCFARRADGQLAHVTLEIAEQIAAMENADE